jgi:hypothetical protein
MKALNQALVAIFIFSSLACGKIDLTVKNDGDSISPILAPFLKTEGAEFVSSSLKNQTTLNNNYKISTSMGTITDKIEMQTPNGFKVYTSVEGQISAE